MDEWINKICYVHISSHKKEENLAICNMDGTWGHYAKWTKSNGERKIPFNLIYMWVIKKKKKHSKTEEWVQECKEQFGGFQRVNVVKMGWVKVAKRYKLPGLKLLSWGCNVQRGDYS